MASPALAPCAGGGDGEESCFRFSLAEHGLGQRGLEQLASFPACAWRTAVFMMSVRADLETRFRPGDDD